MPSCAFHVSFLLMAPLLFSGCGGKFDDSIQAPGRGSSRSARAKQGRTVPRKASTARNDDAVLDPEESMRRDLDILRAREKQQARMIQEMRKSLNDGQGALHQEEEKLAEIRDQVGRYENTLARMSSPRSSSSRMSSSRTRMAEPMEWDPDTRNYAATRGNSDDEEIVFDSRPLRQGQGGRRDEYSSVPDSVARGPFSSGAGTTAPTGAGRTARPDEDESGYGRAYPGYGARPDAGNSPAQLYDPNPFAGAPRGAAAVQAMPSLPEPASDLPPSPFRVSSLDKARRDAERPARPMDEPTPDFAAKPSGSNRQVDARTSDNLAYGRAARDESFTPDLFLSADK